MREEKENSSGKWGGHFEAFKGQAASTGYHSYELE